MNSSPTGKKAFGIKNVLLNFLITLLVGAAIYYVQLPALNLHDPGLYTLVFILSAIFCILTIFSFGLLRSSGSAGELLHGIKANCKIPVLICIALLLLILAGWILSAPILRASAYQKLLDVEEGSFTDEVKEISFNQIPMLDAVSAKKLGDRKLGELSDMVSQFEVGDDYTQCNYQGQPVRVTPLEYGDLIKWFNNRSEGLPAYLIINMVTQKVDVVRLSEGMKISTNEHFGRNLYRHLRFNYPTYMFDTATFEIDDNGTPYWICPRLVKRIGLFGGTDIQGAVLVNAVDGTCTYYDQDVPNWVDRVYAADLIIQQYDYHGTYVNGFLNSIFGQRGVTVTTEGYNYIAMNDDVYMYTGITSVGGDESNVGFILTNQRTKETKYYSIAGAEEYSAMASAEGVVQHLSYTATFPLLLNISNQPTYFMALKDSANLVKMYAMVNVQQYQIVATGSNVSECEANYIDQLLSNNISVADTSGDNTVTGEIEEIRSAVLDSNTVYYIRLKNEKCFYAIRISDAELCAILSPGDRVSISCNIADDSEIRSAYGIKRAD